MDILSCPQYFWGRLIFERSLALIYFIAFVVTLNQFPALLGEKGLLPVKHFLAHVSFKSAPSLFHFYYSDKFLRVICLLGMILSVGLIAGASAYMHPLAHMLSWLTLYFLYLSITNVGQNFYSFGWESMLCEAGFFMSFMGPEYLMPSWIPIIILRWMLFRTEMGAGLIKIRGDRSWRDRTALYYHHETQPMPNPLSHLFHQLPKMILRNGVSFSHFVQLVAPFGLFLPQPFATIAGGLIIFHQLILIVAGNYSWLNWLTVILGFLAIASDPGATALTERPLYFEIILYLVGLGTLGLSYRPLMNLFSRRQKMNYCWNRYHLVGAYGAFGSVTKKRYELIIEGSHDGMNWKEYEFKGKPGNLKKLPSQFAPYHLRLDWMMWFLPFSVVVEGGRVYVMEYEVWFINLLKKLLHNDPQTIGLIRYNPFEQQAPEKLRVRYYLYQFTSIHELRETKHIWKRRYLGEYLPEVSRHHAVFNNLI